MFAAAAHGADGWKEKEKAGEWPWQQMASSFFLHSNSMTPYLGTFKRRDSSVKVRCTNLHKWHWHSWSERTLAGQHAAPPAGVHTSQPRSDDESG